MRPIARIRSDRGAEGAQETPLLARLVLRPLAPPGVPVRLVQQLAVQGQVLLTNCVSSTNRGVQPTRAAPSTAAREHPAVRFMRPTSREDKQK